MLKKIFYLLLCFSSFVPLSFADTLPNPNDKDDILPKINKDDILPNPNYEDSIISGYTGTTGTGTSNELLDGIFKYFRESIFSLLALIAIGVFLYIGARLIVARGNSEELKKTWTSLIYAVIGIVLISLSWAIVRLIAGLDF